MEVTLKGFRMRPADDMLRRLNAFSRGELTSKDIAPIPVFEDDDGNSYLVQPSDAGNIAEPIEDLSDARYSLRPGSPGTGSVGDFVHMDESSTVSPEQTVETDVIGQLTGSLPADLLSGWAGGAAQNAILGMAAGGAMNSALASLGVSNPLPKQLLGALGSSVAAYGMPALGGLMAGISGGSAAASLTKAVTAGGIGSLIGGVSGAGGLDGLAGEIGEGCFGGVPGATPGFAEGGCLPGNSPPIDVNGMTTQALDQASDQLLSQWQVDDESSAGEHVAHKFVNDNKGQIKEAVKDPSRLQKKLNELFKGVSSAAFLPAARITDKDDKVDIVASGMATVLVEGNPVACISDTLLPSGKPILEGAATVLSGEKETARVSSKTAIPSMIAAGASNVLIGGPSAAIAPPPSASDPNASTNDAPADPNAPKDSKSTSGQGGAEGSQDGANDTAAQGDADGSPAQTDPDSANPNTDAEETGDSSNSNDPSSDNTPTNGDDASAGNDTAEDSASSNGDQNADDPGALQSSEDQGADESASTTPATDDEKSKMEYEVKHEGKIGGGKKGPIEGEASTTYSAKRELYKEEGQAGPFTGGVEGNVGAEVKTGFGDPTPKEISGTTEHKAYIKNQLGDELYCKGEGKVGTGGAEAGGSCGLKARFDDNTRIGTSMGRDTSGEWFGGGVESGCKTDGDLSQATCEASFKATLFGWKLKLLTVEKKYPLQQPPNEVAH